jgi:hypothetical protein
MAMLVKSANELDHRFINALVHSFLLAVFGERQLLAENLHAAEMRFERLNEWVPPTSTTPPVLCPPSTWPTMTAYPRNVGESCRNYRLPSRL